MINCEMSADGVVRTLLNGLTSGGHRGSLPHTSFSHVQGAAQSGARMMRPLSDSGGAPAGGGGRRPGRPGAPRCSADAPAPWSHEKTMTCRASRRCTVSFQYGWACRSQSNIPSRTLSFANGITCGILRWNDSMPDARSLAWQRVRRREHQVGSFSSPEVVSLLWVERSVRAVQHSFVQEARKRPADGHSGHRRRHVSGPGNDDAGSETGDAAGKGRTGGPFALCVEMRDDVSAAPHARLAEHRGQIVVHVNSWV